MSRSTSSYIIRLLILVISVIFIGADLTVSAQNANSSTTTQEDASMQNTNTTNANSNRRGRRRRGRRRGGNMNMADTTATTDTSATTTTTTTPVQTGRCDPNEQEQTDLSGTYTGTANYTEGGISGETTLTISGNDFTMTSGSATQEGRVTAVTTCNYTAVTMMFGKPQTSVATGTQPPPLPAVSLRARRIGSGLTLESVGSATRQFSFASVGSSGNRPRARRGRRPMRAIPVGIKPPTAMTHEAH